MLTKQIALRVIPALSFIGIHPGLSRAETTATTVSGQSAPGESALFGQRHQWFVTVPLLEYYARATKVSTGSSRDSSRSYSVAVSFGTFVVNHISLALDMRLDRSTSDADNGATGLSSGSSSWTGTGGVALGWQCALSPYVSFWPSIGLGGSYQRTESPDNLDGIPGGTVKSRSTALQLNVHVPLVLHVTRHVFLTAAWDFSNTTNKFSGVSQSSSAIATSIGIGAWL